MCNSWNCNGWKEKSNQCCLFHVTELELEQSPQHSFGFGRVMWFATYFIPKHYKIWVFLHTLDFTFVHPCISQYNCQFQPMLWFKQLLLYPGQPALKKKSQQKTYKSTHTKILEKFKQQWHKQILPAVGCWRKLSLMLIAQQRRRQQL